MAKSVGINPDSFIENLKKLWPDFRINRQQIRQPTSPFLIEYLEKFFESIGEDPELEMQKINSNPDLYSKRITEICTYSNMLKTLFSNFYKGSIFVDQINFGMLLSPTVQFTNYSFNVTFNYLCFYLKYQKEQEDFEEELKIIFIDQGKTKELENEIIEESNQMAQHKTESQVKVTEMQNESEIIQTELKEYKEEMEQLEKELAILDAEFTELNKECESLQEEKQDLYEKNNIINAHANIQAELKTIEKEIIELNSSKENSEQELKNKKADELELSKTVESDLFTNTDNLIKQYKERENEELSLKKLTRELQDDKTAKDYTEQKIRETEIKIKELEATHSKNTECYNKELNDWNTKRDELAEQTNVVKDSIKILEEEYAEYNEVSKKNSQELEFIEDVRRQFYEHVKNSFNEIMKIIEEDTLFIITENCWFNCKASKDMFLNKFLHY